MAYVTDSRLTKKKEVIGLRYSDNWHVVMKYALIKKCSEAVQCILSQLANGIHHNIKKHCAHYRVM